MSGLRTPPAREEAVVRRQVDHEPEVDEQRLTRLVFQVVGLVNQIGPELGLDQHQTAGLEVAEQPPGPPGEIEGDEKRTVDLGRPGKLGPARGRVGRQGQRPAGAARP